MNSIARSLHRAASSPGKTLLPILATTALWIATSSGGLAAESSGLAATATPVDQLKVLDGFKVELLHSVPREQQGSWVALTPDPKGRLIVSDQYGKLYRLTPPPIGSADELIIEPIDLPIGQAQGLLCAFDSLYVMVANEAYEGRGLYRVRDTNGDDQYDEVKLLRKLEGGGEHGPHAILLSPEGDSLFIIVGNQTTLTDIDASRVPLNWGEDHLLPRLWDGNGFMRGALAPGGWIARTDPDGEHWELIATGFRNEYDAAFNRYGDLFTFDADMEWDMNTPWYRPTRVCLVTSGAEFGWRSGAGKWPPYYPDNLPGILDIGPGSPTGVAFGYSAKFPARYQNALYICDWSYGKLYAVHLTPDQSGYQTEAEEFITGSPLPLTDLAVNPADGALYFAIGGRRTQSALYRVTYTGNESTRPARASNAGARARALRRNLESFHGRQDPAAVRAVWPHLDHADRYIRFAARIALEHQDPAGWHERALTERNPQASMTALLALIRTGGASQQPRVIEALDRIRWDRLDQAGQLELLRLYSLAFIRLREPGDAARERLISKFDPLFPAKSPELNAELAQMLVYLEAPSAATKLMAMLQSAPTQEEQMDYVRALRVLKTGWTLEQREEYFRWFLKAASFKGGSSLAGFLRDMKADAVANLNEDHLAKLKPIIEAQAEVKTPGEALTDRTFVKDWTLDELAPLVERNLRNRDYDRGRSMFGTTGCFACHRFNSEGGAIGPDLTGVAGRFNPRDLLESIIDPSKEISDQYGSVILTKRDGSIVTGRIANLNDNNLRIIENMYAPGDMTHVNRRTVVSIEPSPISMMPEGLLSILTEEEILDLMAFLLSRGDREHRMFR
ncbi:MAG TPA: c-type cytochrome [Methylomirabilota bacterium]|nr:c-type cytochrome [Methylomirabilota bacterium]